MDLTKFAGENIRLVLESHSSNHDIAIWGNPEIFSEREHHEKNLILISIDTLRSDHLGVYGYGKSISPNLYELAKKGVIFKNAIAQAPWTLP